MKKGLPEGVEIIPVYDRSSLITRAVNNLWQKLLEEFAVVILICALFPDRASMVPGHGEFHNLLRPHRQNRDHAVSGKRGYHKASFVVLPAALRGGNSRYYTGGAIHRPKGARVRM